MTDELAVGKEKIRKELEEVKIRIRGHQQLVTQLEFSLLKLRAKPKPFGKIALPEQEQTKLTAEEKFRLRNAAEISKQELGKFLGIRVSDYKSSPESFVVELTVTNKKGTHVGPYYAAFMKKADDSYKVIKCLLPHMIIMSETKKNFPLENKQHLGDFVQELHVCCQSYVDRKDQVEDLLTVRDSRMVPTISYDDGYLFLELGVMLDEIGGNLRIFYHHNKIIPHKFTLGLKDTKNHRMWSNALKLLYKCSLVEALGMLSVKTSPESTEIETDSPAESVQIERNQKSQSSREPRASPEKSRAGGEKAGARQSKSPSSGKAKLATKFSFVDSSEDEANRSARMRKKKAKISSNIRRKTYWGMLSQKASEVSESGENSEASAADSDVAKETNTLKTKATVTNKKTTAQNKNVQPTKSRKRPNEKQSKGVVSKTRRMTTPPAVSDSELSDNESVSNVEKSKKKPEAAIFRKSSATKGAVGKSSSAKAVASFRTTMKEKQPLLAAIFQKARKSLTEAETDAPSATKKQGATNEANNRSKTRQQSTSKSSKEPVASPAKSSTGKVSSNPTRKVAKTVIEVNNQSKTRLEPAASNGEPDELPAKRAAQNNKVESPKISPEKAAIKNVSSPPKNYQSSHDSKTSSSEFSTKLDEEHDSATIISETKSVTPRKLTVLKSNSQESAPGSSSGSSEPLSSLSTIVREEAPQTGKRKSELTKAAKVSLPRIQEESLLQLSPHKQNASEVNVSGNQYDAKSVALSKKAGKKAASEVLLGKKRNVQNENPQRKSPRKKDGEQNLEPGVGSKKNVKKAASEVLFGKKGNVQNENLQRKSPRKKDTEQDSEPGAGSQKDGKKAASKVLLGKRGRAQDEDLPRKSPRRRNEKNDKEVTKQTVKLVKDGGSKIPLKKK